MSPFTSPVVPRLGRWLCATMLLLALWPAQAALRLSDARPAVDLWPAVTMLAEAEERLDVGTAMRRRAEFVAPTGPHANLGVRAEAVWLRVPLAPDGAGDGRWLLEIDHPLLDRLDVHLVTGGLVVCHVTLGDHLPFDARPLATRAHVVALALEPDLRHELLLRVQTKGTMLVPLRLLKPATFHAQEARVQLVQGLAAGLGLSLLLYALAQWAGTRERMFLFYAVTVAGTTSYFFGYHGLASQHLWPGSAWLGDHMPVLAALVALGGSVLLIERMLDVGSIDRRLTQAAQAVAAIAFGTALLVMLGLASYGAAVSVALALGPLPTLLAVPVAWLRWRQGDRAAPYVVAGWGVYALAVVTTTFLLRGWIELNGWTLHAFQAGSIFEMLMWLCVLGVRNEEARDVAARATSERELMQALAHTDALTALPNRRGLEIELRAALAEASDGDRVLDLDGFKAVNDRLGHAAGDELLVAVAKRLKSTLRHRDTVARLGGDEFVILARDLVAEADAWALGKKLLDAFAQPFVLRQELCRVGLTVGFALAPHDGCDGGALLKRADADMYAGKQGGKGTVRRGAASVGLSGA
jgi:diguanylate cyclase